MDEMDFSDLSAESLILLPDVQIFIKHCIDIDSVIGECFSSALFHTLKNSCISPAKTKLCPVCWLSLDFNPHLKTDVYAAVLPIFDQRKKTEQQLILTAEMGSFHVETLSAVERWRFQELRNLRMVVAVPWPDVVPNSTTGNAYKVQSGNTPCGARYYLNLGLFAKKGIKVVVLPQIFQEANGDLFISLLLSTIRGFGQDPSPKQYINLQRLWPQGGMQRQKTVQVDRNSQNITILSGTGGGASTTAPPTSLTLENSNGERRQVSNVMLSSPAAEQFCLVQHKQHNVRSLRETVVGFVGLSTSLAQNTAKVIHHGLCMRIIYHQRHPLSGCKYHYCKSLQDLLKKSDVVALIDQSLPQHISWPKVARLQHPIKPMLSRRSRWTIENEDFNYFKSSAVLICTTSGQSFDFQALAAAIRSQKLYAAAVTQPYVDTSGGGTDGVKELLQLFNVVFLPPASSPFSTAASRLLRYRLLDLVIKQIASCLKLNIETCLPPDSNLSPERNQSASLQHSTMNRTLTQFRRLFPWRHRIHREIIQRIAAARKKIEKGECDSPNLSVDTFSLRAPNGWCASNLESVCEIKSISSGRIVGEMSSVLSPHSPLNSEFYTEDGDTVAMGLSQGISAIDVNETEVSGFMKAEDCLVHSINIEKQDFLKCVCVE